MIPYALDIHHASTAQMSKVENTFQRLSFEKVGFPGLKWSPLPAI